MWYSFRQYAEANTVLMIKPFYVIQFLLIFLLGITSFTVAQENYEVRSVVFRGNKTLSKDFLLERMALKEVSFIEKKLTKNVPFLYNRELVNLDLQRLVAIYQSEGFLDIKAKIEPLKVNDKKQTVKITFNIDEGEPILIDSLQVRFAVDSVDVNLDSLAKKVSRKLLLTKKKRFRDADLNTDVSNIEDAFRNIGYAYVKVDYDLHINLEKSTTHIHYTVNPGPLTYIGKTTIEGNKHLKEKFLQKQISYNEGDLYDKSKLSKTRQNLYELQLFRVVSVLPETDAKTRKSPIPVKIHLEEAPRLTTKFGAGYGTEDKFRAFVDLNMRGLLGGARRVNLYLKHSALEPYSASLRWIQPQFFGKKSSIILNPFIMRNSEPGYDTQTLGLNVPVTYNFNPRMTSTLTYYFEKVQQFLEPGVAGQVEMENDKFLYNKSGLQLSSIFNNSKPMFSPTKGVNITAGYKFNGYLFGGDFNYQRVWADFRKYQQIKDVVLAFRVMAGGIHSGDTTGFIPVEDRFYSGGSNSVRGWNRSELGPKRESGTPSGGKSVLEANIEARQHLFWRLSGVAFIDVGNVWPNSFEYKFNELAYAVGAGLRVETPIGPIRFDVGFPVWNEKKSPQFFISVGQAF
ncbi:outer membrane protein assembly factor BamA [Draconibacterium sp.]|jgi:outer membrane protein insertion porin family